MIKVVNMYMKWEPGVFSRLYIDRIDEMGLLYWYDVVEKHLIELERVNKK